jgi:hypothetical protein
MKAHEKIAHAVAAEVEWLLAIAGLDIADLEDGETDRLCRLIKEEGSNIVAREEAQTMEAEMIHALSPRCNRRLGGKGDRPPSWPRREAV